MEPARAGSWPLYAKSIASEPFDSMLPVMSSPLLWDQATIEWEPEDSYVLIVPTLLDERATYLLREKLDRVRDVIDEYRDYQIDWSLRPADPERSSDGELLLRCPQLLDGIDATTLRMALGSAAQDAQQQAEHAQAREATEIAGFLGGLAE